MAEQDSILVKMPDGTQVRVPKDAVARARQAEMLPSVDRQVPSSRLDAAMPRTMEAGRTGVNALYRGLTAIPRIAMAAKGAMPRAAMALPDWLPHLKGFAALAGTSGMNDPVAKQMGKADEQILATTRPRSPMGQRVANVGEAGISALTGPGGMARPLMNLRVGLAGGLGAEGAAAAFGDSPVSRLLGGLAGGGLMAAKEALNPSNSYGLIRKSTQGVEDADWAKARELEAVLDEYGIPHLKSQLLGQGSSMDDLIRKASGDPASRALILKQVRDVSPRAGQALQVWMNKNLPVAPGSTRDMLQEIQDKVAAIDKANVGASNSAYAAAMPNAGETYSPQYVQTLAKELQTLADSPQFVGSKGADSLRAFVRDKLGVAEAPEPKPFRRTPPEKEVKGLEKAAINNMLKDLNQQAYDEGWAGLGGERLRSILRDFTPEFQPARDAKSRAMAETVTPIRRGLAGDILRVGGGPQEDRYTATTRILNIAFPADRAQPAEIRELGEAIGGDAVGWLLREQMTRGFQQAAKGSRGLEKTPAKFVDMVLGTPAQRQNIDAALEVVAKEHGLTPELVKKGFRDLMEGFGTFADLKLTEGLDQAQVGFQAGNNFLSNVIAPFSRAGRFFHEGTAEDTYAKLTEMVTSFDGLQRMARIARAKDPQLRNSMILATLASLQPEGVEAKDAQVTRE